MSKAQRTKGATFEREIVNDIRDILGVNCKRNLDQTRDGGGDILLEKYVIECKRRAAISVYPWIEQATAACKPGQAPIVVCRADAQKPLAIMRWDDFLALLGNEIKTP